MSLENAFTEIYKDKRWNYENETVSGYGSSLKTTVHVRSNLPKIIKDFNISSILDAPCGDFNWMKEVLPELDIDYLGADIVKPLIDNNLKLYKSNKINFIHLDITNDKLPDSDLLICRDCLFHLHPDNVAKFFINFSKSKIKFLLTTTHKNNNIFANIKKMKNGKFNPIDLFSDPYNLTTHVLYRFDDYIEGIMPREMVLFSREQIVEKYKEYIK